jgi:hypothetical protein
LTGYGFGVRDLPNGDFLRNSGFFVLHRGRLLYGEAPPKPFGLQIPQVDFAWVLSLGGRRPPCRTAPEGHHRLALQLPLEKESPNEQRFFFGFFLHSEKLADTDDMRCLGRLR